MAFMSFKGCGAPKSSLGSSLSLRCVRKEGGVLVVALALVLTLAGLLMEEVEGEGEGEGDAEARLARQRLSEFSLHAVYRF